jgi:hypothetical protein
LIIPETHKHLYLAGPMTGLLEYNVPAFDAMAGDLKRRGFYVHNPADVARLLGTEQDRVVYLRRGLQNLLSCDAVAVLPGWEKSAGAQLEVYVARALEMPVVWAHDLSPVAP